MALVSAGDDLNIEAGIWNDIQKLLEEWRAGRVQFGAGSLRNWPASTVYVKNESQNDVTAGDVLGLGDPVISPTDNVEEFRSNFAFKGAIPSTSTPHYGQYGIVQEAADKTNGYCRCVVSGVTFVKLNITHASDLYCEIVNNVSTSLKTGALGSSRVLWKSTGTGSTDKWGLIRVGEPSGEILVKNTTGGDFTAGSHSFDVVTGTPGSEATTGQTVTAYNLTTVKAGKRASCAILQKGNAYASPQET